MVDNLGVSTLEQEEENMVDNVGGYNVEVEEGTKHGGCSTTERENPPSKRKGRPKKNCNTEEEKLNLGGGSITERSKPVTRRQPKRSCNDIEEEEDDIIMKGKRRRPQKNTARKRRCGNKSMDDCEGVGKKESTGRSCQVRAKNVNPETVPKRKFGKDGDGFLVSNMCHQCQRSDKGEVVRCAVNVKQSGTLRCQPKIL